uniref:Serpin domain-containing protein n=1 Tax=Castor canadensis TaxID=51338 RepID=A0A8C0WQJ9_CASCN
MSWASLSLCRSQNLSMHCIHHLPLLLAGLLALSHGQLPSGDNKGYGNSSHQHGQESGEDPSSPQVAPSNTNFAFRFYHLLTSENPRKNIFFSPLSISTAYAMLSLGAGFNLTELSILDIHRGFQHLLRVLSLQDHGLEVHLGNTLLLSDDLELLPGFLNSTMTFYDPKLFRPDFSDTVGTTKLINDHVKKETRGKITDLVSELTPDVKMIVVNYIYFKGLWKKPFHLSRTTAGDFYVDESTTVKVPMMVQSFQHHWYLQDRHVPCSVLRLDYQGDAVAFFILPDRGKMAQVEEVLTPQMLASALNREYFYRSVEIHFPRFSISGSYALDQILPKLGFQDLFSQQANFSGITTQRKLQVFHKATLDVNEVGTEATAVTSSFLTFLSAPRSHLVVRFNRPFLLTIFSPSTQSVLFWGKVVDPTAP